MFGRAALRGDDHIRPLRLPVNQRQRPPLARPTTLHRQQQAGNRPAPVGAIPHVALRPIAVEVLLRVIPDPVRRVLRNRENRHLIVLSLRAAARAALGPHARFRLNSQRTPHRLVGVLQETVHIRPRLPRVDDVLNPERLRRAERIAELE